MAANKGISTVGQRDKTGEKEDGEEVNAFRVDPESRYSALESILEKYDGIIIEANW